MSVLVTTTFSQGAVFYAGETVSCTIAFTNPLPTPPKPPSASSSTSSSYSRRSSARFSQPPQLHPKHNSNHSRSPSLSSFSELAVSPPKKSALRQENSKSATATLTSLASSTFSFFTGQRDEEEEEAVTTEKPVTREDRMRDTLPSQENGNPISIELEDVETPRSSMDLGHLSRRSSMDSLASSVHPFQNRQSQLTGPRLSQILLRSSSSPALAKKPEHLLWGFAQVVGNFIVDPTLINNNEFAPLKRRTMYRPHGAGIGGGGGLMMGKPDAQSKIDTRTTPVISTPPSILFVDLDLAPGETKKFSYKLKLPNDIPPSHRGKAIRFNYSLVVGTQRAASNSSSPATGQGHIVQVPFRVLNHVAEDGSRPIYDLMNPVVLYKDEAIVEAFSEEDFKRPRAQSRRMSSVAAAEKARVEFINYIDELLEHSTENSRHEITRRESDAYDEATTEDSDEEFGLAEKRISGRACARIVSRITNTSRKAMFDICKNNQRVAHLNLTKTAYRLGEAVMGVLDFEHAIIPTYEVSILLESSEIIEPDIALRQPAQIARISRKCYAEHHSFCLSHRRLAFSLPIPAIASPEFQTTGVKLQYYLKFEFIVAQKKQDDTFPNAFIPINVDERHKHYQGTQDVDVSTFDCQIPIRVYGAPGGTDRAVYGRPFTFIVQ